MHIAHKPKVTKNKVETKGTLQAKNSETIAAPKRLEGQFVNYPIIQPCWEKKSFALLYSTTMHILSVGQTYSLLIAAQMIRTV
jgi:hypothetical protein